MVSNTNEQNGRQPPLPKQQSPPKDPRIRPGSISNVTKQEICKKFVWGICNKGAHCRFRHELVFDEMLKILTFCHNYQNKQGCTRIDCTYLHATTEEETLFKTTRQLPRALQERYAAMHYDMSNIEGSQMMFATPPPPPPPQPLMSVGGPTAMMSAPSGLFVMTPTPQQQMLPVFPTIRLEPPPPPPPRPPAVATVAPVQTSSPVFKVPPPPTALSLKTSRPVVQFDPSRPPPIIPVTKNTEKRKIDFIEAGPSKIRKPEDTKGDTCDSCIQREIRIDLYKQNIEKLQYEEECQRLSYKIKMEEYEKGKEMIRSLVNPEIYFMLNEYIEGGPPQTQDSIGSTNAGPMSEQFLLQLMQLFLSSRNSVDAATPPRAEDIFLNCIPLRRPNVVRQSASVEIMQTIVDLLSSNSNQLISQSNVNGHFANGQKLDSSPASTEAQFADNSSGSGVRKCSRAPLPGGGAYPLYQPSVPPPGPSPVPVAPPPPLPPQQRPYYPHQYPSTCTSTATGASSNLYVRGVSTMQATNRPSLSTLMPPNNQTYQYSMMGRYPQTPRYFPPYQ